MKLLKFIFSAIVIILILNYFHLLSPEFSKTVDNTSKYAKEKLNGWEESPLVKRSNIDPSMLKSLADGVSPVNFKANGEKSFSVNGQHLSGTYFYGEPQYIELTFDALNSTSVKQAETILSVFKGEKLIIKAEQLKGITTAKIKIIKTGTQFKVDSNFGNL